MPTWRGTRFLLLRLRSYGAGRWIVVVFTEVDRTAYETFHVLKLCGIRSVCRMVCLNGLLQPVQGGHVGRVLRAFVGADERVTVFGNRVLRLLLAGGKEQEGEESRAIFFIIIRK